MRAIEDPPGSRECHAPLAVVQPKSTGPSKNLTPIRLCCRAASILSPELVFGSMVAPRIAPLRLTLLRQSADDPAVLAHGSDVSPRALPPNRLGL
jgi:hypothetical protein